MKKFFVLACFCLPLVTSADIVDSSFFSASITLGAGPYIIATNVVIPQGVTVTAEPGTIIKFLQGGSGSLTVNGVLDAEGTGAPIVFTSSSDDIGGDTNLDGTSSSPTGLDWAGITVGNGGSFICDNCTVRYSGYNVGGIKNNGGVVAISNSSIASNGIIGILTANGTTTLANSSVSDDVLGINQTGGTLVVSDSVIADNRQYGIFVNAGNSIALVNNIFSGNAKTAVISSPADGPVIFTHAGNISSDVSQRGFFMTGTIPDGTHLNSRDLPVLVTGGQIAIASGTTVYIDPGTIIKLGDSVYNGGINVSGNLIADGTANAEIYFTSINDDSVGGDTNGDGAATIPRPDTWNFIGFAPGSTGDIQYASVRYGGIQNNRSGIAANIYNFGGNLVLAHDDITNAGSEGFFQDAGTTTITFSNFNNETEDIDFRDGSLSLNNNDFENGRAGVNNLSGLFFNSLPATTPQTVDARNNWWGRANGPYEADTSSSTSTGSFAYGDVLYDLWLTVDPLLVSMSTSTDSTSTPDTTGTSTPPTASSTPMRIPVIIVPGIMATQLFDGMSSILNLVWPNLVHIGISVSDDFLDSLEMTNGGISENQNITQGDILRGVIGVDYFNGLISSITNQGYEEGTDLFVFPYDWRLDISQTAVSFKQKIDQIEYQTGSTKVDVVAHSLGGLVVKEYLKDYGGNNVDTFIDVATPHTGAPESFKTLMYGDDLGIHYLFGVFNLNQDRIKTISQNMSSVYELLPSENYFDNSDNHYKFYVFNGVNTNQNLTFQQTEDYLDANGRNQTLVANANTFHQGIDGLDPINAYAVKTYNIVGCGMPTIGQFYVLDKKSDGTFDYDIKMINGDGTVPLKSAQAIHALHTYYVKGGEHATLPSTSGVKELVASLLNGDNPNISSYPNLSNSVTGCTIPNGKIVSFHSPITLNIYDSVGNHAGPDTNGDIEDNIPGADYETIEDNKFAFLPDGQDYKVTGQATEAGTFDARIESIVDEEVATTTIFHEVPINKNSQTQFTVGTSVPDTIDLDENGDGVFESSAHESEVFAGFVDSVDHAPSQITSPEVSVPKVSMTQSLRSSSHNTATKVTVTTSPIKQLLSVVAAPIIQVKNTTTPVATTSKNVLKKSSNVAAAYQSLTKSVKNMFISLWSWIKKRL